jgi:hypothetical protein
MLDLITASVIPQVPLCDTTRLNPQIHIVFKDCRHPLKELQAANTAIEAQLGRRRSGRREDLRTAPLPACRFGNAGQIPL